MLTLGYLPLSVGEDLNGGFSFQRTFILAYPAAIAQLIDDIWSL